MSSQFLRRVIYSCSCLSKRTGYRGYGPNGLYKVGLTFVGVHPHPLKYYNIWDKKPYMDHGIQGTNHLIPGTGKVASKFPVRMQLKKDKIYAWCCCGRSGRQPLCDGTHNREKVHTQLKPVRFIPREDTTVWFCNCKQTKNRPFCDGTHKSVSDTDTATPLQIEGSGLKRRKVKLRSITEK